MAGQHPLEVLIVVRVHVREPSSLEPQALDRERTFKSFKFAWQI